jgi:hypothetical protein
LIKFFNQISGFLSDGLLPASTGTCFLLFTGLSENIPLKRFPLFHFCPAVVLPQQPDRIAFLWSDESFLSLACLPVAKDFATGTGIWQDEPFLLPMDRMHGV